MQKIVVKDTRRNTAACEACQERKRKCDGVAPCSFCVGRNMECKFAQQKKRGPSKRQRTMDTEEEKINFVTTITTAREAMLFDKVEALRYLTMYFRFDYNTVTCNSIETLLAARTSAHQVQLYAALADAAQSCGDFLKGRSYIDQARLISGSIFDSVDCDTVKGLVLMRKYWYHTLNFTQCTYYSSISWSLAKLVKVGLDPKTRMFCQLSACMSDFTTSMEEKLVFLRGLMENRRKGIEAVWQCSASISTPTVISEPKLFQHYINFAAAFMEHFHFSIFYPLEESLTTIFKDLNHVHLDEHARMGMLESVNAIQIEISSLPVEECPSFFLVNRVFCLIYQMLINWRSGHLAEAMANALTCVNSFDSLRAVNLTIANTNLLALVVGYSHICLLGSLIQFFVEQGQTKLAGRVEALIADICKTRGPEYDAIKENMVEFRKSGFVHHMSTKQATITLLNPESSPYTSEQTPSPSPPSASPTPPMAPQDDIDMQLNSLQLLHKNNDFMALMQNYDLGIDMTKPITPQLLDQLRTINLNSLAPLSSPSTSLISPAPSPDPPSPTSPPPSSSPTTSLHPSVCFADGGLRVNNAIVFQQDPNNIFKQPNITSHTTNNNNSNNNNYNTHSNASLQDNTYVSQQNNTNTHEISSNPAYQLHPSLQRPIHYPYYTSFQLPSQPSHPSHHSNPSSPPLPSQSLNAHPSHPFQPSPTPQPYSPSNNITPFFDINNEINQDTLALLDQFLCTTTEGYCINDQDSEMEGVDGKIPREFCRL